MDEADKRLEKPKSHNQTVIVLLSRARVDLSEGLDDHYEGIITEKGQFPDQDFLDYSILTATEVPSITSLEVETDDPERPFGAKKSQVKEPNWPLPLPSSTQFMMPLE